MRLCAGTIWYKSLENDTMPQRQHLGRKRYCIYEYSTKCPGWKNGEKQLPPSTQHLLPPTGHWQLPGLWPCGSDAFTTVVHEWHQYSHSDGEASQAQGGSISWPVPKQRVPGKGSGPSLFGEIAHKHQSELCHHWCRRGHSFACSVSKHVPTYIACSKTVEKLPPTPGRDCSVRVRVQREWFIKKPGLEASPPMRPAWGALDRCTRPPHPTPGAADHPGLLPEHSGSDMGMEQSFLLNSQQITSLVRRPL